MKNVRLNLDTLKVKSFVTEFENGKEDTVKGGLLSYLCTEVIRGSGCCIHPTGIGTSCTWDI
ncbi:MAG: pinensin family lanthipeptide [Bacteroidota bacterium]